MVKQSSGVASQAGLAGFVPIAPVDNFYQTCAFIPMSFALVTTVHDNGETGIGPHALVYPFSVTKPYSMLLISRSNSGTAVNIHRTGKCALNYVPFDRERLNGVANMGYPGMPLADKQRANPYTLVDSPTADLARDPEFPQLVAESVQIMECTWDDRFGLQSQRDAFDRPYESHFTLNVDRILMDPAIEPGIEQGSVFPEMPIFYGYRANRGFWFAEHAEPFSVALPKAKGMEYQSIFYQANRIDSTVRFTKDACKQLTAIPEPFMKDALQQLVDAALAAGVAQVDEAFLQRVNDERNQS